MEFISIFNDVLGPIMRGPSSSHTAGAYRIARLCCSIYGSRPDSVTCTFDPDGSYAPTYEALGVDLAFAAGLLGWEMTDGRYKSSLDSVEENGTDLSFRIEALKHAEHPNTVRITMESASFPAMTVWAKSTGGGVIEIYLIDDLPVKISGKAREQYVYGKKAGIDTADRVLTRISPRQADEIEEDDMPAGVRIIDIEPVFFPQKGEVTFLSAADMVDSAKSKSGSLGEVALEYEAVLLGMSRKKAIDEMLQRYDIMKASVAEGLHDEKVAMQLTDPSASGVMSRLDSLPDSGPTARAAVRALAAMHTCNSRGIVCAAPTGGSAGVIPGVMMTLEEELDLSEEAIARALFAAASVGLVVARRATFAAETAGCQVEIGVAGAMAAAAVVEAYGGDAETAAAAAAISLQNTMGLVCDPVHGGCEIPCHTRNAVAASNAFTCATLVLGGHKNPIPLDETVDAAFAVGCALPRELRCTALGGIAVAPSALSLEPRDIKKA